MKASEKIEMYRQIENHGRKIINIFNLAADIGPVDICKKLRRIENKAANISLDHCNGVIDTDQRDRADKLIVKRLDKILNFTAQDIPVFINGDPRGYTLKIDDQYIRENNIEIMTDWGGYGILAPDFTPRD